MVTTTAARTKTTTMASASKDPIALISVRPAIFPNVNQQKDGPVRQIASEATTVRFRRIEVEGDAVLDARRNAQAVTAYALSPTLPTSPT